MAYKAYYKFNPIVTDFSGNGKTLTNVNTVVQSPGIEGMAADFSLNNINKALRYSGDFGVPFNSSFTINCFVKMLSQPATNTGKEIVFLSHESNGGSVTYLRYYDETSVKKIRVTRYTPSNGQYADVNIALTLTTDKWFMLSVTGDSNYLKLFVNAAEKGSTSNLLTAGGIGSYNQGITIAAQYVNSSYSLFLSAAIDEVIIDSSVWSIARIKNEFSRQRGFF